MSKPIKVLVHSNYSRMVTGFGKNMKNILLSLHQNPNIEVIEAANGVHFGADTKTPWKCYGTAPSDQRILQEIGNDPMKQQMASYGFYHIDQIVEDCKPDIYLGIEDIWAFREFEKKPWWNKVRKIIWTTLDSIPLLPESSYYAGKVEKFFVWASFAEEELRKQGVANVETLHGAIDYSNFRPLENRSEIRKKFHIDDSFVIGFVFKNQLRKSVPNLLEGFRLFKECNPNVKTKLLLHTDWGERNNAWDIPRFIEEKKLNREDILASYVCHQCANYFIHPYIGEEKDCPACGSQKTVHTKNSGVGVSETQLNEIYNCMDVYCHPFTSGGQELPIQEAKAAGLITLVTDYSCGSDSCHYHQGGIPLEWEEYREPHTQFVKATTRPESIREKLENVLEMSQEKKDVLLKNGQETIFSKFNLNKITLKLQKTFEELMEIELPEQPPQEEEQKQLFFEDLLDKDDAGNRLAVVIPESGEDVLMVNSLLDNIKSLYPEYNIYVITRQEYFDLVEDNPNIHRLIPFQDGVDNLHLLEGKSTHRGYFEIAFLPHVTTQKYFNYHHNGKDKLQFELE
jgi:DNA-directed RNA polymerase subunit RPC12/RpoP